MTFVRELSSMLGERALTQDGALLAYASDATPLFHARPEIVVQPVDTDEVREILRIAAAHRVPVTPRGAGTNLCAGTVPLHGGIVISMTRMNRLLELSGEEMLAVCQPGLTAGSLDRAAAELGLMYVPDPGSREVSTVGGNVACCAGGLRGLKYGVTRQYVLGLEFVLTTGEVIRSGGRLVKDVAGYDLTRLLVGSEGTLGVITEIIMGLLPRPAASRYGVAYFDDLEAASAAVTRIVGSGLLPATLEFLDATCIGAVDDYARLGLRRDAGALLLFGDDGDEQSAERSVQKMAALCAATAIDVTLAETVTAADALLAARRCSLPALARLGNTTILEDVTVPRPRLAAMVARVHEIGHRHGVLIGTFGHAGDGNLHPTAIVDGADPQQVEAADDAFTEIFRTAVDLGGTITGEHGVGAAKLRHLAYRLGDEHVALLRRIKRTFDPPGILNPGKLGS